MIEINDEKVLFLTTIEIQKRREDRVRDMLAGMTDEELIDFEKKMRDKVLKIQESFLQ